MQTPQAVGGAFNSASVSALAQLAQFGNGGAAVQGGGNCSLQLSATGIQPGATGADNVLAVYSLPANSFDQAGRGIYLVAQGTFAATANNKRVKIIVNPASAVVGSTVGANGTTVVDTGTFSTNALTPWIVEAQVFKTGAANSNTQLALAMGVVTGTSHGGVGGGTGVQTMTATENTAILIAVTGNAGTVVTDIALNMFQVQGMN